MTAAQVWRTRLREALLAARKDRDAVRVSALRSTLSAIDNAETPDRAGVDASASGTVAGAVVGLGAAEVARRELSDAEIRALLRAEIDERLTAADDFTAHGHTERASAVRAEAAVLTDLLGDANIQLHSATAEDAAFIVEMARHACVIEDWLLPDADSEDTQSLLPGSGDIAVVAADATGVSIGAVWTFHHDPPLLVDIDGASLPEVAVAVAPEMRGRGVGGTLLDELVMLCTGKYNAISLNVHERNPAAHLYQRKGFRVIGRGRGTVGIAMRRDLQPGT
ncbi:GNAT family N-acetyltransferase [Mycobacterium sp. MMS18-G62]